MANSESTTIDVLAASAARIDKVCSALDDSGWHRPTALPVWDVQDVVAHLGSLEAVLLGRDEPAHEPGATGHVRNALGLFNEGLVDRRRDWPSRAVLDEFREATAARVAALRELDEAGLDREVLAPNGRMVPQRQFLGIRVWDFFVHELDISDALGHPLPLDTTAGRRVLDEMLLLLPRAVAKAGLPEGAMVRVDLGDPLPRSVGARVEAGRGVLAEPPPAGEATLHLRASPAVFLMVGSGRRDPRDAIAAGDLAVTGDAGLAVVVLGHLNVVP